MQGGRYFVARIAPTTALRIALTIGQLPPEWVRAYV
jgi:hypothetical protein